MGSIGGGDSPASSLTDALASSDLLVVGAGLFGLVMAECARRELGARVLIIDRRDHPGGNVYSDIDGETGIEIHRYGTHIFHTASLKVWQYLRRFTDFTSYRHRVIAVHRGKPYSMPINLGTMCQFFGQMMTPDEARQLIAAEVADLAGLESGGGFEEKALRAIGPSLYEAFIKGYTAKQWQRDPRELPPSIFTRLPVRFTFDDSYFSDPWQGLPAAGYGEMVRAIVKASDADVRLGVDYHDMRHLVPDDLPIVYTGPLDAYFGLRAGPLAWRSLRFEFETLAMSDFQGTSVVNYSDIDVPWTRVHEFRHLHPERQHASGSTVIAREFSLASSADQDPYYPVNSASDRASLTRYREMARNEPNVFFGGRLGSYAYLDMDMAVSSALTAFREKVGPRLVREKSRRA